MTYASFSFLLIRFSHDTLVATKKRRLNSFVSSTRTSSRSSASVSPHQPDLYTACEIITIANPNDNDDDDDTDDTNALKETKNAEMINRSTARRGSIVNIAAECTFDSIAAINNIINMILVPMVIVPFLDYRTLGKIPRSNTAKPGTSDGAFAKMGSLKSISQPRTQGWTVIFVSVRIFVSVHP
jgi:hypothetical protein